MEMTTRNGFIIIFNRLRISILMVVWGKRVFFSVGWITYLKWVAGLVAETRDDDS